MRLPVRPLSGRWAPWIERHLSRFFWPDPRVVMDDEVPAEVFARAMSAIQAGDTIKITGTARHVQADALLTSHVDLAEARIVDLGASDGSTSVELIGKLPGFAAYTIADLYLFVDVVQLRRHTLFFDPAGVLVLVAGSRLLAWPSRSRAVLGMYRRLRRRAASSPDRRRVILLNPQARRLIAADSRVGYAVRDVFERWDEPPADVIKIANLLRRLYFGDDRIRTALQAVFHNLVPGGHLLIVDNPRIAGIAERAGLYRRADGRFVKVAQTPDTPEIDDLVTTLRMR